MPNTANSPPVVWSSLLPIGGGLPAARPAPHLPRPIGDRLPRKANRIATFDRSKPGRLGLTDARSLPEPARDNGMHVWLLDPSTLGIGKRMQGPIRNHAIGNHVIVEKL